MGSIFVGASVCRDRRGISDGDGGGRVDSTEAEGGLLDRLHLVLNYFKPYLHYFRVCPELGKFFIHVGVGGFRDVLDRRLYKGREEVTKPFMQFLSYDGVVGEFFEV